MSRAVSVLCGIFNKLIRDLPSGWNEKIALEESLKRFQDQTGKPFKFLDAFHTLKEAPKYKMIGAAVPSPDANPADSAMDEEAERPPGNKREKKNHAIDDKREERRQQLVDAARDLVRIAEEKKQIAEDQLARYFLLYASFTQNQPSCEETELYVLYS